MKREALILYSEGEILKNIKHLNLIKKGDNLPDSFSSLAHSTLSSLISFADSYQLEGNLWKNYIAYLVLNDQNPYSVACEFSGKSEGSINDIALKDFAVLHQLFNYDISTVDNHLEAPCFAHLLDYTSSNKDRIYNHQLNKAICSLVGEWNTADTPETFKDIATSFYARYGVGDFGFHRAFKVQESSVGTPIIVPIINYDPIELDHLIGYERPKEKLVENTRAFVQHKNANNCLIFGDAGTGKSSSVRAVLNKYHGDGLRIIEIYKHQLHFIDDIIGLIKNRNYRFILFMDDLSFEEFETDYKYLKSVIEGGLEMKPNNLLIYATSNRRHLIREHYSDRLETNDDLHISDTAQEKLSLSARFGVTIFFIRPEHQEFHNIVLGLAKKHGIVMPKDQLLMKADRWDLNHGGARTGRTAQQFIDHLVGTLK